MRPQWWKQWVPLTLWSQFIHFGSGQCTYMYGTDLVLTVVTLHFSRGRAPNCTKLREYSQGPFISFLLKRPDHQRTTNEVCSHVMIAKNHVRCFLCDVSSFGEHAEILTPRVFDPWSKTHVRPPWSTSFVFLGSGMKLNMADHPAGMSKSRDARAEPYGATL